MDYRSPFEIRQSILEEVQSMQAAGIQGASSMSCTGKKDRSKKSSSSSSGSSTSNGGPSAAAAGSGGSSGTAKDDPSCVEKEMPGIENLNALNANMHLEEEVQRHIESEKLPQNEVCVYIMNNGSTNQKISMFQHLFKSVKDMDEKKTTAMLNSVLQSMWVQAPELQAAAPSGLSEMLAYVSPTHATEVLIGGKAMLEVSTLEIRQAWSHLALECLLYMEPSAILQHAVPLSLKKCEHTEPHDQRVLACTMMGRMCTRLNAEQVTKSILSKALAMCQDTNVAVRCEMCTQLREVARSIGLEQAKQRVTAELFELLSDEERLVSRAAFSCLIDLIEFFDAPYRREHFFPIIKSYISSPPEEVLSLLIEEFGRFLWKIRSDIQSSDDVTLFASFFRQSTQKADAEVRRMCAYNLPAVVASLPSTAYASTLHACTKSLSVDSHTPVRRAIAAGLHEIANLLQDKAAFYLCDIFSVISQDPSMEVRTVLMRQAPSVLQTFSAQLRVERERDAFFMSLIAGLQSFDQQSQKDWRKTAMLLEAYKSFPEYYSGTVLFDMFIPTLQRHLREGANIIRDTCAQLLMSFTASVRQTNLVVDVFHKVTNDLGKNTSCYQRLNFVRVFSHACDYFSRRFIKERMLELLLELSRDAVAAVRQAVAQTALKVRRVLKPPLTTPADQALLDNFQGAVQRLLMDEDELVRNAARDSAEWIEPVEREYGRLMSMKSIPPQADDIADKKRDEAEGNLIEAAKEYDKAERRNKLKELLKSEREKEDTALVGGTHGSRKSGGPSSLPPKRTSNLTGSSLTGGTGGSSALASSSIGGVGNLQAGKGPAGGHPVLTSPSGSASSLGSRNMPTLKPTSTTSAASGATSHTGTGSSTSVGGAGVRASLTKR